jgi:dissimilatory sulfite reductase (desulfoviridin) alpha/beta subunit
MKWTSEAESAIKKVPFFVRKRVKARVEKEAYDAGKAMVTLAEVKATQQRYLSGMASEIKGYRIEGCFGGGGCPNRICDSDSLMHNIEAIFETEDLLGFLKSRVSGDLKFHHEFAMAIADCPNACSQPQIRDIGIIGAKKPSITEEICTQCGACIDICKENAITIESGSPRIDENRCLFCGQCIGVCPSGTIAEGEKGFRILLGGKLGRHPRLAEEIPGIFSQDEILGIAKSCIALYKQHSNTGQRFAAILTDEMIAEIRNFIRRE